MPFYFVLCSLIRTSDFVALDACGAYSSIASLKKVLSLTASSSFATRQIKQACLLSLLHRFDNKNKKQKILRLLFCIVLVYSYLCSALWSEPWDCPAPSDLKSDGKEYQDFLIPKTKPHGNKAN